PPVRRGASTASACATRSRGTTTTTSSTAPESSNPVTARSSIVRPSSSTNALGTPAPSLTPEPAAGTTAATLPVGAGWPPGSCSVTLRASGRGCGGQDLVEEGVRPLLVGLLGQRQLADQHLTCLCQHALLAGGQAPVEITPPEVAADLGHLVDVPGRQLLAVRLVAAGPVGGLFHVLRAQDLEDLVEPFAVDHVTHAHILGVLGRDPDREVAL